MADFSQYPIFDNNRATLKETSKDDHSTPISYMTTSLCEVINFDAVKSDYIKDLRLVENPKSNDALVLSENGRWTFIEFKNGYMDNQKKFDVRKKVFDSLLMFTDILGKGISYTRTEMDYILVYNEDKNPTPAEDNIKTHISNSPARDKIAKTLMGKGRQSYIKYGLEIFKNYCFQEVYTYTEQEFSENFVNKHT